MPSPVDTAALTMETLLPYEVDAPSSKRNKAYAEYEQGEGAGVFPLIDWQPH